MPDTMKKKAQQDAEPSWNVDPTVFTELLATHKFRQYHNICLESSPDNPLYNVVCRTKPTQPFDIELHDGVDKAGPTLGVVRLHINQHKVGVGDPNYIFEEDGDPRKRIVWENFRKPALFSINEFFFDYGEGKERKSYVWRRVRNFFPRPFTDIELWEVGKGEGDDDGLPLAIWKRNSTWGLKTKNGSFFLRRPPVSEGQDVEGKRWEAMVLLTALALHELAAGRKRG